jgi:hypothetical protein
MTTSNIVVEPDVSSTITQQSATELPFTPTIDMETKPITAKGQIPTEERSDL